MLCCAVLVLKKSFKKKKNGRKKEGKKEKEKGKEVTHQGIKIGNAGPDTSRMM